MSLSYDALGIVRLKCTPFTAPPPPAAPVIAAPAQVTSGHTYTASTPAQPGLTYFWSFTDGVATSSTEGSSVTFTAGFTAGAGALIIRVTATDPFGSSATGTAVADVFPIPPAVAVSTPRVATAGQIFTAEASVTPGWAYSASLTNGSFVGGGSTGLGPSSGPVNFTIMAGGPGPIPASSWPITLSVVQINPAGDASSVTSAMVTGVNAPLPPTITGVPGSGFTVGVPTVLGVLTDRTALGMAYRWVLSSGSGGAGSFSPPSGLGPSVVFTPTSAGPIEITVTETNPVGDFAVGRVTSTVGP